MWRIKKNSHWRVTLIIFLLFSHLNALGILKRRFPYVVHMRNRLDNATKIVMCCVVLHNITITWHDELLDEEDLVDHPPPRDHVDEYEPPQFDNLDQALRRRMVM